MKIDLKLVGGILLIIGICIGGGMLALPLASAPSGFINSTLFLVFCWLVMTLGALLILEVNLWLPPDSNIISMAKKTLGLPGSIIAWTTYILLLYTLLSAYISAGSDIVVGVLSLTDLEIPQQLSAAVITIAMAILIYTGIKSVDYINRGLIIAKFTSYFLLVIFLAPHIKLPNLTQGEMHHIIPALMVLITSFGFATIVPTLRSYFEDNVTKLRTAIIIGSLVPLVFYIIWNAIIMGFVPLEGTGGLVTIAASATPTADLSTQTQVLLGNQYIPNLFRFFAAIAILTSFLGVSICLFDFLADALNSRKHGYQGSIILSMTFLPPLIIILFFPGIFISALNFAGIACVILLVLLPATMAWYGRYKKDLAHKATYTLPGGKYFLSLIIIVGLGLTIFALGELLINLMS